MSGRANLDDRQIIFERWWNVRDLGGLPLASGGTTRKGVLYRSAGPQYATESDVERARELGLTGFVDLRRNQPEDWRHRDPAVRLEHVNLIRSITGPRVGSVAVLLRNLLDQARGEIAAALRAIVRLAHDGPVVFHCHTGKDRTGLLAIVLLKLSGVPDDVILDDYLASNPGFEAMRDNFDPESFMSGAPAAMKGPVTGDAAIAALQFLEESGGVAAYLESAGMSPGEIEAAAAMLRRPPAI